MFQDVKGAVLKSRYQVICKLRDPGTLYSWNMHKLMGDSTIYIDYCIDHRQGKAYTTRYSGLISERKIQATHEQYCSRNIAVTGLQHCNKRISILAVLRNKMGQQVSNISHLVEECPLLSEMQHRIPNLLQTSQLYICGALNLWESITLQVPIFGVLKDYFMVKSKEVKVMVLSILLYVYL